MWIQIIDDQPFIDRIDVLERSRAEIQEARKRLWQEFLQEETRRMDRDRRRAEELSKPKELAIIAQDAIEWEI